MKRSEAIGYKEGEHIGIPQLYEYYKKTLIYKGKRWRSKAMIFKDKHRFIIDHQKFSNILKDFNLELARLIIEENLMFRMPANLGTVRIKKYKKKIRFKKDGSVDERYLIVNWKKTREFWAREYPGQSMSELKLIKNKRLIYHLNEHTERFICKLYWNKHGCNITNKKLYSIILTRTNKRQMAALIKNNPNTNYYE